MLKGWKRMTDEHIDDLKTTIISDINKYKDEAELKFYVGCDSQMHGTHINYTKAIALRKMGKGVLCYFKNERIPYKCKNSKKDYRTKLFEETYKIVDIAKWLDDIIVPHGYMVEQIHADLNPSDDFLSNCAVSQCLGYIRAMGYVGKIKPEAWCASSIANRKTK